MKLELELDECRSWPGAVDSTVEALPVARSRALALARMTAQERHRHHGIRELLAGLGELAWQR